MSDYIKREDAIFIALQQPFYSLISEIKQLEGIDIVRCKECRYWNTKGCRDGVGECEWAYYMTKPNDYCSYGERREP